MMHRIALLATLPALLWRLSPALAAAGAGERPATPGPAASGDFAGLVEVVPGHSLYLQCQGEGSPTVVLESGFGDAATTWTDDATNAGRDMVFSEVARFTRVCAYDRPGTITADGGRGRSDGVPQPRVAAGIVHDLHALLAAAGVAGPYVLVGHSIGGLYVRLFTARFPDEVAGVVLVDPSHEDQVRRFRAAVGPEHYAALERLQNEVPPGFEDFPELEQMDFATEFAAMAAALAGQTLGPRPLAVLSHGRPIGDDLPPDLLPGFPWDAMERAAATLYPELAALSPESRHVVARQSGHYIHQDEPDLVVAAIRQVVEAVRHPGTWSGPSGSGGG